VKTRLFSPLVTGFLLLGTAGAETWRVGGKVGLPTVSDALASAAPGDTIEVAPGEYHENLVVDKSVVIVGEGNPHLRGTAHGDVVRVLADDVEVRGFTISGSGADMLVSDAGVKIVGARARVADNVLFDNLFGVYLRGCTGAMVENNRIRGRAEVDMGRRGAGIHFFDAHHNIVRGNRVTYVRDGVYFDHADDNTVEDNEFSHLRYGVHYMYCEDNRFFRNVFRDSVGGARSCTPSGSRSATTRF